MRFRWKAACIARSGALEWGPAAPGSSIDCVAVGRWKAACIARSGALESEPAAPGLSIDCVAVGGPHL